MTIPEHMRVVGSLRDDHGQATVTVHCEKEDHKRRGGLSVPRPFPTVTAAALQRTPSAIEPVGVL